MALNLNRNVCWKCSKRIYDQEVLENGQYGFSSSFLSCLDCNSLQSNVREKMGYERENGIKIKCRVRSDDDLRKFVFLNSDSVIKISKNRFTYHYSKSTVLYTTIERMLKKIIWDLKYFLGAEIKNYDSELKNKFLKNLETFDKNNDDFLLEYDDSSCENNQVFMQPEEASTTDTLNTSSVFEDMDPNEIAQFNQYNLDQVMEDKSCDILIVDLEGLSRVFSESGFSEDINYQNIDLLNGKNVDHSWF